MSVMNLIIIIMAACVKVSFTNGFTSKGKDEHNFPTNDKCETITVPLCKDLQYNETVMPNSLGHQKQEEAGLEVHQFFPLVKVQCSPYLKFFLCTIYVPVCTILEEAILPCKSLCVQSRSGCEAIMNKFGFVWPDSLNCDKFPESGLCVGENRTEADMDNQHIASIPTSNGKKYNVFRNQTKPRINGDHKYTCLPQFKVPAELNYRLVIGSSVIEDCGMPCSSEYNIFFGERSESEEKRRVMKMWIFIWSLLCAVSTIFTVLTFAVDSERFKYPERPVIFLSVCYFVVSVTYMVGVAIQYEAACSGPFYDLVEGFQNNKMQKVVTQGTKEVECTVLFVLVYYFSMASSIWWVVLTLTWFLAAGLKWGHEAIQANAQYFHLAAWVVPAIKTITIIILRRIDGDVLSGVCFTGIYESDILIGFILAPLMVYLALGTGFLLTGLVSLFRIRTIMKHDGTKTDKLEKLMIRIGIFSVLYILPATIVIGCYLYEYLFRNEWITKWHSEMCKLFSEIPCPAEDLPQSQPDFYIYMMKYLMMLVVGITSGFWIWSGKTITSWKNFYWKICRGGTRRDELAQPL